METNTANNPDKLTELMLSLKDGRISIAAAVQHIRDAVEYIESSSYQAGHLEGEAFAKRNSEKSNIYTPY